MVMNTVVTTGADFVRRCFRSSDRLYVRAGLGRVPSDAAPGLSAVGRLCRLSRGRAETVAEHTITHGSPREAITLRKERPVTEALRTGRLSEE
jgi:hypothetical protein